MTDWAIEYKVTESVGVASGQGCVAYLCQWRLLRPVSELESGDWSTNPMGPSQGSHLLSLLSLPFHLLQQLSLLGLEGLQNLIFPL